MLVVTTIEPNPLPGKVGGLFKRGGGGARSRFFMETEPNFSSGADPVLYNKSRILHYYNFLLRFLISFLSYIKYKYKYRAAWHGTENLKLVF